MGAQFDGRPGLFPAGFPGASGVKPDRQERRPTSLYLANPGKRITRKRDRLTRGITVAQPMPRGADGPATSQNALRLLKNLGH